MTFRPTRKLIGIATAIAVALFVTNPELFALSYVIGSIGFDVFLLFLTFQFRDQIGYVFNLGRWILCRVQRRSSSEVEETKWTTDSFK